METLEQTRLRLEAFAQETNPDADFSPGSVISELIVKFAATLHNPIKNELTNLGQANTIVAALYADADTYNPIIAGIASNYGVSRNDGRKVTGVIKLIVSQKKFYFIEESTTFQQANINKTYAIAHSYTVDPLLLATDNLSANQRRLILDGDGNYYCLIPVIAVDAGVSAQVSTGTSFILGSTSKLAEFVKAESYGAFTSGQNKETDRELITRFKLGLTTKNLVSSNSINAVLKEKYPTVKNVSIVGANDAELIRAKNNVFGIAIPGMADVYVRNVESLETSKVVIEGTQIVAGKWGLYIPETAAPGFYRILSIIKDGEPAIGTLAVTGVTYGIRLPGDLQRVNQINSATEARFTKYQTCAVVFDYTPTNTNSNTENFLVTLLYQPFVKEIQDLFLSDDERIACADYLVKAAIPCNVSLHLKLLKKNVNDLIPTSQIKQDIYSYINNIPFGEDISVSSIIDICHDYNIKRVDLPVTVKGTILVPNATADEEINIESNDLLVIPARADKGVTNQTTTFFINYFDNTGGESISIEVV